ncbi:MAG: ABC transporter permease [Sphingomonadales bacterium 32-68-7]|nr:MAG: ABC transporter permease [Sphingomonadales bacterium 12-68-11]OYX08265.1 MAG: ABC transporter permease [Sphingomonadales bacterium 32-68-7]
MSGAQGERLSRLQAAFVIARRDFTAILFSRAFFFFLLGPLFPIVVGALAGGIGNRVQSTTAPPQIGVAMQAADVEAMLTARQRLAAQLGPGMPAMVALERLAPGESYDARGALATRKGALGAVLTGTPEAPQLTVTDQFQYWAGPVALVAAAARDSALTEFPRVRTVAVASSAASDSRARMRTAQAGQLLLFLLTMLLAGMVLSNLVEEKANKVIEILAAAVPMDAVFLGKLFAMLAVSLVGISVWGTVIGGLVWLAGMDSPLSSVIDLSNLVAPGVGWPLFFVLAVIYFSMAYLLLGSIYLAIGSLATTVREVQTLSMPVTMGQVLLFFFASLAIGDTGDWVEWAAAIFPFSSPFAMLARAAMDDAIWPHFLALAWQAAWVALSIRLGATLFRRRVMMSGPQREKRRLFGRKAAPGKAMARA